MVGTGSDGGCVTLSTSCIARSVNAVLGTARLYSQIRSNSRAPQAHRLYRLLMLDFAARQRRYRARRKAADPEGWRRLNKERHRQRYSRDRIELCAKRRAEYQAQTELCNLIKGDTPCVDCGQSDLYYLMDFDHIGTKQRPSPYAARSWNELSRELALCEVVCVRCHRIRTYARKAGIL